MKSYLINNFKYDRWANEKILKSLNDQKISDENILRLFSHIILAEKIWMMRIKDQDYEKSGFWNTLMIEECEKLIPEINDEYISYINSSREDDLNKSFEYINSKGILHTNSFAEALTHVAFHSTYHRGQIAKEVRRLKKEPVLTDYIAFIREK